jgi:hypothetical protein
MTAIEVATGAALISAIAACATAVIGALRDQRNRRPFLMAPGLNVGAVGHGVMRVTNSALERPWRVMRVGILVERAREVSGSITLVVAARHAEVEAARGRAARRSR